ncbi:variant surface glycoprotein (VSG)-related, putative [Trypanosoma brucei brucei TREU927]|uniref:Variant surface glycoprotein (VSG)-related, putative n=1 Tax=Trypanosoma brucei brucei (strain 927/4 GUTat10.1) TaxID=185431 RepID=Q57XY4_TRYB2|nr:variant surface glycoprotein (VSG)-related, putative [Trypanosoma brucei brucei TREU927]AAX69535.1 variant surface glycoprotein (VSG)-related, putative [Trypanosoma brucei]AAZ10186.1 variant surface glycoprotein (VSG)-related, putative [Trypanosoma brucei brucei TREU927]
MRAINLCTVLLALVFPATVSGSEWLVNGNEFKTLCGMINLAEAALGKMKEAQEITKGAARIGAMYLEMSGDRDLNKTCEGAGKRNCALHKVFWNESKKELATRGNTTLLSVGGLSEREVVEIRKKVLSVAQIFQNITKNRRWVLKASDLEKGINRALYGVPYRPQEIKARSSDRRQVCEQQLSRSQKLKASVSLSRDLLCLCAPRMNLGWKAHLCCKECVRNQNEGMWETNKNATGRWHFLKKQCSSMEGPQEGFNKLVDNFRKATYGGEDECRGTAYTLGGGVGFSFWRYPIMAHSLAGHRVRYVVRGRNRDIKNIPWMRELLKVFNEMRDLKDYENDKRTLADAIEKLQKEFEESNRKIGNAKN